MKVAFTLQQFTGPRTPQLSSYSKVVLLENIKTPSEPRFLNTFSTMSLSSPVPIALCGKSQVMATNFSSSMEKEGYEGLSFPSLSLTSSIQEDNQFAKTII